MGHYTSIRGWLQMSEEMVPSAREIIQLAGSHAAEYSVPREVAELYLQGFVFREKTINWSTYIFYGADIRTYYVQFIESLIREIAENVSKTDGEFSDRVRGIFHVSDEDIGEMVVWLIDKGELRKTTTPYPFSD